MMAGITAMRRRLLPAIIFCILCMPASGCSQENLSTAMPAAYGNGNFQAASSADEIFAGLVHSMERNEKTCWLLIQDTELINAEQWLSSLPGIMQIHCEYLDTSAGCITRVSMDYWDNYAIAYAARSQDMQYLTDRQRILYDKYMNVISSCTSPENSDYENELAIHDYLAENLDYDTNAGTSYNAYEALVCGRAVCGGYAECFKTFMDLLGIENVTLSGTARGEEHIWNAVKLDGRRYQVDVTWDDPVNASVIPFDHAYFNISDTDMAIDHAWSKVPAEYGSACETRYTYPEMSALPHISSDATLEELLADCIGQHKEILEFVADVPLDLKACMPQASAPVSYVYRTAQRSNYILYTVAISYES